MKILAATAIFAVGYALCLSLASLVRNGLLS